MIVNAMTTKFQMVLPCDLASELRALADGQGIPLAQLIRETMMQRLRQSKESKGSTGLLSRLKGMGSAVAETDLSVNVDKYLYNS